MGLSASRLLLENETKSYYKSKMSRALVFIGPGATSLARSVYGVFKRSQVRSRLVLDEQTLIECVRQPQDDVIVASLFYHESIQTRLGQVLSRPENMTHVKFYYVTDYPDLPTSIPKCVNEVVSSQIEVTKLLD